MSLTSMFTAPFAGRMADRIGGKYILMVGVLLFSIGMSGLALVAGPDSTWINFLVPAVIAGLGIGMTFAPMTTVAMRNIKPQVAGSASAVLNTIRQMGAVIGSAVIGALLQNRLSVTLHEQALGKSSSLPASFRDQFVAIFTNVSSKGLQIGTGQSGATLPSGIPPAVAHQLSVLAHDVFVTGYIEAMKQVFVLPIAVLLVTAASALLIQRRPRAARPQEVPREEELRAAAG
jgi:MFS family permease